MHDAITGIGKYRTPCGTRTRNLRIRSPTPCPLGQGGFCFTPVAVRVLCLSLGLDKNLCIGSAQAAQSGHAGAAALDGTWAVALGLVRHP